MPLGLSEQINGRSLVCPEAVRRFMETILLGQGRTVLRVGAWAHARVTMTYTEVLLTVAMGLTPVSLFGHVVDSSTPLKQV